jgi:hypothetical protein
MDNIWLYIAYYYCYSAFFLAPKPNSLVSFEAFLIAQEYILHEKKIQWSIFLHCLWVLTWKK